LLARSKSVCEEISMTSRVTTAALVLAAVPVFAGTAMFAQTTGVSRPDPTVITSDDATPVTPRPLAAKPSATVPATTPATTEVYGPYVPYTGPKAAGAPTTSRAVTTPEDPLDAMVVTSVPEREGTLHEGTLLKTKMLDTVSTSTTTRGTRFTAAVTEAIERNGRVIIPVGSVLEGRVTEVRGGKRITGGAALHLETSDVTLPDGTHYIVHAQLVGIGKEFKLTEEGTVKKKEHPKETLAVMGGVTGAGAVTGAMIGGGVGAAVGAGIGAGVSTVIWLKQDRQATLEKDSALVFSLTVPMELTPLRDGMVSSAKSNGTAVLGVAQ
jgi:hypothetical protein